MATSRDPHLFTNELKLQTVDKKSKYTVFGYIRKQQNNDLFDILPKLITVITLAFYTNNPDRFNPKLCGKHITIKEKNTVIDCDEFEWSTVYGTKVISSTMNGIYKWKIKNIGKTVKGIVIGIDMQKENGLKIVFVIQKIKKKLGMDIWHILVCQCVGRDLLKLIQDYNTVRH